MRYTNHKLLLAEPNIHLLEQVRMSITVSWDNEEKTIARYTFSGKWTWLEFQTAVNQIHTMVRSVPNKVDYLAELQHSEVPVGNALFHIRRAIKAAPKNSGLLVVSGGSSFVSAIFSVIARFTAYVRVAPSLDEARAIIAERQRYRKIRQSPR
jgi:hypothetical protein